MLASWLTLSIWCVKSCGLSIDSVVNQSLFFGGCWFWQAWWPNGMWTSWCTCRPLFLQRVETEFLNSEIYEISKFLSCDLAHVFATEILSNHILRCCEACWCHPGWLRLIQWFVSCDLGGFCGSFWLTDFYLSAWWGNTFNSSACGCDVWHSEFAFERNYQLQCFFWGTTCLIPPGTARFKDQVGKNASSSMWKEIVAAAQILVVNSPHWIDVLLIWKHFCGTLHTRSSVRGKKRNSAANATRFDAFKTDWWTCLQTFWLEIMRSTLAYSSKADYTYWWGDERRKALGKGTSRNWGQEFWMFWVSWNCGVRELEKDHVFVCFRCLIVCLSCFHLISTLS